MATAGARRYARAIFELARDEGQLDNWARRLAAVRDVLSRPEARSVLANPSIAVTRRQEAAAALMDGSVDADGANLARLLVGANRLDDLDGIIGEYERLADDHAGRVRASATTAVPLSRQDADRLAADLSKRLGEDVRLEPRVDPSIIGGLVLRIGDRVIDASVATRLQQLRQRLAGR